MLKTARALWTDDAGVIISAELVMVMTIAVLSTVVGLHSVVGGVITELGDIGTAIGHANQSMLVTGFGVAGDPGNCPWKAKVGGFQVIDEVDVCDGGEQGMHKDYGICDIVGEQAHTL